MKLIAALLASSFLLMGATCQERDEPPSAVVVRVPVPVPCDVAEPVCSAPAYDAARKDQPMDDRVKLLRAESIERENCLARYRTALQGCRQPASP